MTDTAPGLPRLGTTLFSLTLEQRKPGRDFASLVGEVADRDLGPGLEMVAFQSLRGWPRPTDEPLAPGEHDVAVSVRLRISYMPVPGGGRDAKKLPLA